MSSYPGSFGGPMPEAPAEAPVGTAPAAASVVKASSGAAVVPVSIGSLVLNGHSLYSAVLLWLSLARDLAANGITALVWRVREIVNGRLHRAKAQRKRRMARRYMHTVAELEQQAAMAEMDNKPFISEWTDDTIRTFGLGFAELLNQASKAINNSVAPEEAQQQQQQQHSATAFYQEGLAIAAQQQAEKQQQQHAEAAPAEANPERLRELESELAMLREQIAALVAGGATPMTPCAPDVPEMDVSSFAPPPPPPPPPPASLFAPPPPLVIKKKNGENSNPNAGRKSVGDEWIAGIPDGSKRLKKTRRLNPDGSLYISPKKTPQPKTASDIIADALKRKFAKSGEGRQSIAPNGSPSRKSLAVINADDSWAA